MHPLAQAIIVICVVALTAALIATLLSLKRTATRAETVLQLVEREIRPMASQLGALSEELRTLSGKANHEMERVGVVVQRIGEASAKLAWVLGAVGGLAKVGQIAGIAAGVKKGLDVFVARLRNRHH
jgi:uncharacterized protein YoxC